MQKPLSQRLSEAPDLATVLECVLHECRGLTGASLGNVQLLDRQARFLTIEAQHGFQPEFLKLFEKTTSRDGSACGRALLRQSPVVIQDIMTDPAFAPYREVSVHAGFRAVASVPILSRTRDNVGVLSVHFASSDRLSSLPMERLVQVAGLAADAILVRNSERSAASSRLRCAEAYQDCWTTIGATEERIAQSRDLIRLSREVMRRHQSRLRS